MIRKALITVAAEEKPSPVPNAFMMKPRSVPMTTRQSNTFQEESKYYQLSAISLRIISALKTTEKKMFKFARASVSTYGIPS